MVDYTPVEITHAGNSHEDNDAAPVTGAGANRMLGNSGREFLSVQNGATAAVITVTSQKTAGKQAPFGDITMADLTVTIPANETTFIGPFAPGRFNDGSGRVVWEIDDIANVLVAAFRLPSPT